MNFALFRRCPDFDDPCYAPGHINTVCRPFVRDLDTWQGSFLILILGCPVFLVMFSYELLSRLRL